MMRILVIVLLGATIPGTSWSQWKQIEQMEHGNGEWPAAIQGIERQNGSKSLLVAIGLSLLLPGSGEWYAGNFQTGKYFMAADGALWLTYGGFTLQGTWIRDDARTFAAHHAGASLEGKDEQFEVNIGNFNNIQDYNQAKLRNREFDRLYSEGSFDWSWDNPSNRVQYRSLRIKSDQMFQNSRFVVGALVINRIISAFSAWRSAANYNKNRQSSWGWKIETQVQGAFPFAHGIGFKLTGEL